MNQETSQPSAPGQVPSPEDEDEDVTNSMIQDFLDIETSFTLSEDDIRREMVSFAKKENLDEATKNDILSGALLAQQRILNELVIVRTARVAIEEKRGSPLVLMAAVFAMERISRLISPENLSFKSWDYPPSK